MGEVKPRRMKFSDEEIAKLYDEWKKSGLNLKRFCESHVPPLKYATIQKRFRSLERKAVGERVEKIIGKVPEKVRGLVELLTAGREVTEADLRKIEWLTEFLRKVTICQQCIHCRTIDIEQNLDCDLLLGGKVKTYCRNFKPKEEKGKKA
jgi:hypothetical protein